MIRDGAAIFVIRTNGGPDDGVTRQVQDFVLAWPLPRMLTHPSGLGYYRKTNESKLPDDTLPYVARGAEYVWIPFIDVLETDPLHVTEVNEED